MLDLQFRGENLPLRIVAQWYGVRGVPHAKAVSEDGRKFEIWDLSYGEGRWGIVGEVKNFVPLTKDGVAFDGSARSLDFAAIVQQFISTQFSDEEWMTPQSVHTLLLRAENGRLRFGRIPSLNYYTYDGRELASIIEEVLLDLFCASENDIRVLHEENGTYWWSHR